MIFKEDLIVDFVKSRNRQIVEKHSYTSGTGQSILTMKTANYEVWKLIGGRELAVYGVSRGALYYRPSMSKTATRKWREFAVSNVSGFQRDTMLGQFIQDAREAFVDTIDDLLDCDTLCKKYETIGNEELKHLMALEEKKFSCGLESCRTELDYQTVRQGVLVNRAYYGREVNKCVKYILDYCVERDIVAGQRVYHFTPIQEKHLGRLSELQDKIDMIMKHQIYRADQKETQSSQTEQ